MVHSTAQYFEKRIDELERRVFHLQMQVEKISRNSMLSERQSKMIERRDDNDVKEA